MVSELGYPSVESCMMSWVWERDPYGFISRDKRLGVHGYHARRDSDRKFVRRTLQFESVEGHGSNCIRERRLVGPVRARGRRSWNERESGLINEGPHRKRDFYRTLTERQLFWRRKLTAIHFLNLVVSPKLLPFIRDVRTSSSMELFERKIQCTDDCGCHGIEKSLGFF